MGKLNGDGIGVFFDDFFRELGDGKQAEGLGSESLARKEPFLDSGIVDGGVHVRAFGVKAGEREGEENCRLSRVRTVKISIWCLTRLSDWTHTRLD